MTPRSRRVICDNEQRPACVRLGNVLRLLTLPKITLRCGRYSTRQTYIIRRLLVDFARDAIETAN